MADGFCSLADSLTPVCRYNERAWCPAPEEARP
jgi:hypothetical protein